MERRVGILMLFVLGVLAMGVERAPWHRRRRPHPNPNRLAMQRVRLADWPDEPASPDRVDPQRFAEALREICGWMPPGRATRYSGYILGAAEEFDVDPFLLGALVYREGRCRSDAEDGERGSGVGLTLIDTRMYWENLRGGTLRYQVHQDGRWVERTREARFPFNGPRLTQPEENVYFAAMLLDMWRAQEPSLGEAFEHVPHRHFVSHFVWGDRVRSARQEDRILTERRRLLQYYGAHPGMAPIEWGGLTLGCPLHGCPRVISSYLGSERDGGSRHHRGIDLESLPGEPVRAIADGLVVFAGVDLPGHQSHRQVRSMEELEEIGRDGLGAGGRYVCIRHRRPEDLPNARSCYMHLTEVRVQYGDVVERGQTIGTVGRTGMQRSAAHLHLELHTDHLEDPSEILYGLLLGNRDSDPMGTR